MHYYCFIRNNCERVDITSVSGYVWNEILNYLNILDSHLKFTMENKMQKTYFLDVTICKQNKKIITSWYRK